MTTNDNIQRSLSYDQLVIATGSHIRSNLPFKGEGTHEDTLAALHSLQEQIAVAKSVLISGAGATGVETASELAAAYGADKDTTLIIAGERVLQTSHCLPSVSQAVERDLQKLGVNWLRNTQVQATIAKGEEDAATQATILTLSNGTTLVADLYLPLFGVQVNTSFLPSSLHDSAGTLLLDQTMRVVETKNVWGIGDVGNVEPKRLTVTDARIIHLSATLDTVLTAGEGTQVKEYKPSGRTMIFHYYGEEVRRGADWRVETLGLDRGVC